VIDTVFVSDTSDLEQRLARQAEKAKHAEDASVGEVIDYVKAYAKQETLGPLKGAGSWLGYGFAAAAALGLGLVLILIGLLRLLQTEWERSATGNLSWLAYLIVLVVASVLLVLTLTRIKKSTLHKEPK
jgi:phosphoglycerol transferase MdoB-like AlkP superfamily enzyme